MRVLITGAAGFVGRYLADSLAGAGHSVLGIDIAEHGGRARAIEFRGGAGKLLPPPWPVELAAFRKCDIRDVAALSSVFSEFEPDAVFHLAAQSSAARSFEDPLGTLEVNLLGTAGVLEAVRLSGVHARILITGSCDEYGVRSPGEMPLKEDAPIEPASPYAASKAAQNMLARQYRRAYGLDVVLTRSFNHTGPGQPPVFVLPSFASQCANAAAGRAEAVIRTGNLEVTRDFLDVRDVVAAYMSIVEKGRAGEVYNVCSGRGLLLADALDIMLEMAGGALEVEKDPALSRPVDMPVLVGDNGSLARDCGWEQRISTEQMISDLFYWWSSW